MEIKDLDYTLTELTEEEMSSLTGGGFNFGNTGTPGTGGFFNANNPKFTGIATSGNQGSGTGGYFNPNNPHFTQTTN
jgi:hypothetical protein